MNLKTILEQLNIPVAYDHFNVATEPPFICFRRYSQDNFGADNKVYKVINNYYIYLVTEYKDIELEQQLENLLTDSEIYFEVVSEDYISDENTYQIIYEVTLENEENVLSI